MLFSLSYTVLLQFKVRLTQKMLEKVKFGT